MDKALSIVILVAIGLLALVVLMILCRWILGEPLFYARVNCPEHGVGPETKPGSQRCRKCGRYVPWTGRWAYLERGDPRLDP